jgi:DNA-binding beta-propeller fold protein YncE
MRTNTLTTIALLAFAIAPAWADHHVSTVVDGLDNPSGIAIQPETGHIFVSDSGASRVIRVVDGKAQDVITGFPVDVYGKGPMYNIGPLGLAFLDKNTLVVGGGGLLDGAEMLRVYKVPEAGQPAIKADKMEVSFNLAENDDVKGEGNFYGLAANGTHVFVTSNGDDTKGWVARATIKDGKLANFERFLATKEATEVDAPVAVTISPRGELVIGQMGEITIPGDGLLTFYNAKNGKLLLNLETGLGDITALAYSPKGQLYATDFNWINTSEGGLYQLISKEEDGKQSIEPKKIEALDKATAMVFGADGSLYITVIGTGEGDAKGGKLLKIAPGL